MTPPDPDLDLTDALVKKATNGLIWLQFAADAEWPHTDSAKLMTISR